jgi:CRISPR-associated protein Cas2
MKRTKNYLICYDISDEKRLAKVAKYLEKVAFRIQYSIYYLQSPSTQEFLEIQEELKLRINEKEDDVKIYTIKNNGFYAGIAINLNDPFIIT